ncbi:MAG: hypothetical protein O8C64_06490 [Candidatus Methanoperedens sp.]|nr:hypothetical protein [Candidatus Methanoperedens sp.]MCZ7405736.1 hypothetical protein [Candidatus Methanoperedens sp.]
MEDERKKIMEKRSSLRSWRERGGKLPRRNMPIAAAVVFIVLLTLIFYSFSRDNAGNSTSFSGQQNNTSSLPENISKPTPNTSRVQVPGIKLNSPVNIVYNTSTPPLDLAVTGKNLSVVSLSVDGGGNFTIPNDGKTANAKMPLLIQVFRDDFSSTKKWDNASGKWSVKNGRYAALPPGNFSTALADMNISTDKFAIEGTINNKGTNASGGIIVSNSNSSDFYYAIALAGTKQWAIGRYNGKFNHKIVVNDSKLQLKKDYKIKLLIANGEVTLYTDGIEKAKYNFGTFLGGNPGLLAINSSTEFDDFSVFQPLSDGRHNLTIFAKNTAGNTSTQTVKFNISLDIFGKLGMPGVKNGLEITVKSVTPGDIYTSVWVSVRNLGNTENPFKLTPSPVIIDNTGNQYESIKVARSGEIAQTNLYSMAKREGAIFFERPKEGASMKKLVLYVNGDKFEYTLDAT